MRERAAGFERLPEEVVCEMYVGIIYLFHVGYNLHIICIRTHNLYSVLFEAVCFPVFHLLEEAFMHACVLVREERGTWTKVLPTGIEQMPLDELMFTSVILKSDTVIFCV